MAAELFVAGFDFGARLGSGGVACAARHAGAQNTAATDKTAPRMQEQFFISTALPDVALASIPALLLGRGIVFVSGRDLILGRRGYFALGSRSRSTEEELPPVGEGHIDAHTLMLKGLGLIALDDELGSDGNG